MPHYFFHLTGEISAHDMVGHERADDEEAKQHGNFIAHRVGTEKPEMVCKGNSILVVNATADEIARLPISSSLALQVLAETGAIGEEYVLFEPLQTDQIQLHYDLLEGQ
jgi:hypothetical protein